MQTLRVAGLIFAKDLRVEWRNRETLAAMCVFGILVIFLFNFAPQISREESLRLLPVVLWVAFAFAGVLGFNRSFTSERDSAGLEAMALAPIDPGAIFLGKMLANLFFLAVAEVVMVFAASVWYSFSFFPSLRWFAPLVFFGSLGYVALGTIFGAVAANTRMREVMLPVLQFPVSFVILILAMDGTSDALRGDSAHLLSGIARVAGVSLVFVIASYLLFEYVLEE